MRQYKARLNPLLAIDFASKADSIARIARYQDFRAKFRAWFDALHALAKVKARKKRQDETVEALRAKVREHGVDAFCALLDLGPAWDGTEASELAGAIFFHVSDWGDELEKSSFPASRPPANRDIAGEISEASLDLHFAVCEAVGILISDPE
jgi:hypothetical protein